MARCLAVTGASGYIGQAVVKAALATGWQVTAFVRDPARMASLPNVVVRRYALEDEPREEEWQGVDCIIHLAAVLNPTRPGEEAADLHAARALAALAGRQNCRLIFISSQSARLSSPSGYGHRKAVVEQIVTEAGGIVIRPGMVYGGEEASTYGILCRLLRSSPVIPVPCADAPIHPIHIDELAKAILCLAEMPTPPRLSRLGSDDDVSFADFLTAIARYHLNGARQIVPLPTRLVMVLIAILRRVPLLPKVNPERVVGLAALPPLDSAPTLRALGLRLRPVSAALSAETTWRRRSLLAEGLGLIAYAGGKPPKPAQIRRYATLIEAAQHGVPLALPVCLAIRPWIWRLADPSGLPWGQPVRERLAIAARIAESDPAVARRLLQLKKVSLAAMICRLGGIAVREALLLPMRAVFSRLLDLWLAPVKDALR